MTFFEFFKTYLGYTGTSTLDSTIVQYALAAELVTYVIILFGIFTFFRRLLKW